MHVLGSDPRKNFPFEIKLEKKGLYSRLVNTNFEGLLSFNSKLRPLDSDFPFMSWTLLLFFQIRMKNNS